MVGGLETVSSVIVFWLTDVNKNILLDYAIKWFHYTEIDIVWDSVKIWASVDEALVYLDVILSVML